MAFEYGGRLNKGDYFSTKVDVENQTAETKGTIDGEPVEFSGGGLDFVTVKIVNNTEDFKDFNLYTDNSTYRVRALWVEDEENEYYRWSKALRVNANTTTNAKYVKICDDFRINTGDSYSLTITGDAEYYDEGGYHYLTISGDCEITCA